MKFRVLEVERRHRRRFLPSLTSAAPVAAGLGGGY
jgi:hypothetical protein